MAKKIVKKARAVVKASTRASDQLKNGDAVRKTPPSISVQQQSPVYDNRFPVQVSNGDEVSQHEKVSSQKTAELNEALKKASGKRLLICMKGYPDPDNIGSALALQWLASTHDIESHIVYFEEISHYENRALVKKLDLDLEQWTTKHTTEGFDFYAVNDSQSPELPIEVEEHCRLLCFVDHHKSLGTVEADFVDIRETAGSTSAVYAEYLSYWPRRFKGDNSHETKIATALMHGIRSDTDNFVNATSLDYKASEFLADIMDKDLLTLISRQAISAKTMDLTQVALQHKDIRETYLFSGVGFVREEDRDGIGQTADYLLHREGIETVVVYGVVGNAYIDGSLRTKSHTVDPDKWLKDVFGKDKEGKWYGGGRKDKGGFQIPLGVFSKCSDRELLWILIKKTIDELFYEKIGIDSQTTRESEITSGKI